MIIWERGPRGGWRVIDDRLAHFDMLRRRVYYGYTKREAKAEHAQFMRDLAERAKFMRELFDRARLKGNAQL